MQEDIRRGIIETAQALGMDPATLATIISYETAGTFDPVKAGPTTQWGRHRGLIQWGEPQARQYGVDWNDPIGSQLGANGAIVRYYRDRGWRPGMSEEDAYSIVNAGAPGLGHRTDANNGGAPGTVSEKVRNQFGPHRKKALALLGEAGGAQPGNALASQPAPQGNALAGAAQAPQGRGNALAAMDMQLALLAASQPRTVALDPAAFQSRNALAAYGFGPGQSPFL